MSDTPQIIGDLLSNASKEIVYSKKALLQRTWGELKCQSTLNKTLRLLLEQMEDSNNSQGKPHTKEGKLMEELLATQKANFKEFITMCFHKLSRISNEHFKDLWC